MPQPQTILVTGSAGRIGQAAVAALGAAGHRVRGIDVRPTPGVAESIVDNLQDGVTLYRAAQGVDVLIHLAATPDDARWPRGNPPDEGDNFLTELLPNNIVTGYHALEAARRAGVRKVVLASTGQVVWEQAVHGPFPVPPEAAPTPRYWYACTKLFLEGAGAAYARQHVPGVLAVRLGFCPRPGQLPELHNSERAQDVYLSPGDAGRFFVRAVEADFTGYHVVYATSRPVRQARHDYAAAERLIGFVPQDRWPEGAPHD